MPPHPHHPPPPPPPPVPPHHLRMAFPTPPPERLAELLGPDLAYAASRVLETAPAEIVVLVWLVLAVAPPAAGSLDAEVR